MPVKEDQEEKLSRRVWERGRQVGVCYNSRVTTAKGCEYELLIIRYFFGIIDFLGFAAP